MTCATLIVSADGGADQKKKMEENKKGDSKGSGRAESGANNKEGTTSSSSNVGTKSSKQDPSDGGSKRLVPSYLRNTWFTKCGVLNDTKCPAHTNSVFLPKGFLLLLQKLQEG